MNVERGYKTVMTFTITMTLCQDCRSSMNQICIAAIRKNSSLLDQDMSCYQPKPDEQANPQKTITIKSPYHYHHYTIKYHDGGIFAS